MFVSSQLKIESERYLHMPTRQIFSGKRRFRVNCSSLALICFLVCCPSLGGQSLYGTLVGQVTDVSGALIPRATVTLTRPQTGGAYARVTTTDGAGAYSFSTVAPGEYSLNFQVRGFRSVSLTGVTITAGITTRSDTVMQVGEVSEQVTVTASTSAVQSEGAEVRHELSRTVLERTPIPLGRNYESLLVMLPGVAPPQTANSFTANPSRGLSFSVNGTSNVSNNVRIDGATSYNTNQPQATAINPSLESIETVNVVTSSFAPEQGLTGGSAVSIQIKSGTNQLHGSGFWFHNDEHLSARPYFGSRTGEKAKYRSNQKGGSLGGPIKRNRIFFFASYERTDENSQPQKNLTVPTVAMRKGDLSGTSNPIYDPLSGAAYDPARPTAFAADRIAFPGNQIPASRISAPVQKILAMPDWALPNVSGSGALGLTGNYLAKKDYATKRDQIDTKVNYNLTDKWTLFHRLSALWVDQDNPAAFGILGGPGVHPTNSRPGVGFGAIYSSTVSSTYIVSPKLVVDGYFGYTLRDNTATPDQSDVNVARDKLGIPGTNGTSNFAGGMARFLIDNFDQLGYSNGSPSIFHDGMLQYAANATHTRGTHEIKTGFEVLRFALNQQNVNVPGSSLGPAGGFMFRVDTTTLRGGPSGNAYNSMASVLLGLPREAGRSTLTIPSLNTRATQYSFYVGDRWKVSSKLVVTYGLRWEYFPFNTRDDRGLERYDFATNEVLLCGVGSIPKNCGNDQSKRLFAPRAGIAWRVRPTFVVRSGYGITYDPYSMSRDLRGNYPTSIAQQLPYPDSRAYSTTLVAGLPQPDPVPAGNGRIPLPLTVATVTADGNYRRGYIQSWNFTLEKQIGDWVISSGYVATRSIRQSAILDAGWSLPGQGSQGSQLFKLFKRTASTQFFGNIGVQKYDSLQTQAKRRFRGFQVDLSHTWAHSLGYLDESSNGSPMVSIPQYWSKNYGPTSAGIQQKFVGAWSFDLPFGRGKRWLTNGLNAKLFGGWQASVIMVAYTGFPVTPTASATVLNAAGASNFADCTGAVVKVGVPSRWWSRQGLADPNTVSPTTPRFGTCGAGVLRGPGLVNLDTGVSRRIKIGERATLDFRGEGFNMSNTPHFGTPGANISGANFGVITSVANTGREGIDQRIFRLGLRAGW